MTRGSDKKKSTKKIGRDGVRRARSTSPATATANQPIVKRVLLKAADIIETKGWHKGDFATDRHGWPVDHDAPEAARFCVFGAAWRAEYELGYRDTGWESPLYAVIGEGRSITDWNDASKQTRRQVVAKLREAASHVR